MRDTITNIDIDSIDIVSDFDKSIRKYDTEYHYLTPYATSSFMPMDTNDNWVENQKIQQDKKTIQYYLDNPIEYRLNNFGFRTDYNFKYNDEVNIFLGCSHTMGIGHHLENTWSYIVNKEIGGNFVNLAVGGVGIENQFRKLLKFRNYFKIKNIFHFQPLYAREEFLYDDNYASFMAHMMPAEIKSEMSEGYAAITFGSDNHVYRKYITNVLAIESISNGIGAEYYFNYQEPECLDWNNSIQARDFMHHPIVLQNKLANLFLNQKKNKQVSDILSLKKV